MKEKNIMTKNKIGFKASLKPDENENENKQEVISPDEIEQQVKENINAEQEYEAHMTFHHKLIQQNKLFKLIFLIIGICLALYVTYMFGWYNGADYQIKNNKPYKKIIDKTGKEYIIK